MKLPNGSEIAGAKPLGEVCRGSGGGYFVGITEEEAARLDERVYRRVEVGQYDQMLDLLKELEWAGPDYETSFGRAACGICEELKHRGHAPDCRLAAVLREAEGGPIPSAFFTASPGR
jgi:hypothetical protein